MKIELPMIEALIFSRPNGITMDEITKIINIDEEEIIKLITELNIKYNTPEHGVELIKLNEKYRFVIKPEIKTLISKTRRHFEISGSQFEVLAILFLNGPSRLSEIEKSRQKNSVTAVQKLLEMGLIKKVKKENTKALFLYTLSENFYEWIPESTLAKLQEIKNGKIADTNSEIGNSQT